MPSAFKLFPPSATEEGEYGTSPYGQEDYGGSDTGYKYVLPDNEIPGDDPTRDDHRIVGEVEHRRAGILLGARKFASKRLWVFHFGDLGDSDVDSLVQFWDARRFKFMPDAYAEETYYTVHWIQKEFHPVPQRGTRYAVEFTIEEV
jgi:hypothetical protein